MNDQRRLSPMDKLTVAGLLTSAAGVVMQMLSGVEYPAIPPVLFILLIPAGLIAFGRWRWTPITASLAGVFLTFGLFASNASTRLFDLTQVGGAGGSVGLWIQMLAVDVAGLAGIIATLQRYGSPVALVAGAPGRE